MTGPMYVSSMPRGFRCKRWIGTGRFVSGGC